MAQELDRQELLKLFRANPERVFLLFSHNGTVHFVRNVQEPTKDTTHRIPVSGDISLTKLLTERFGAISDISYSKELEKQFFSHPDPHFQWVRYARIADDEIMWVHDRYPWDFIYVYVDPPVAAPKPKRTRRKQANESTEAESENTENIEESEDTNNVSDTLEGESVDA